MNTEHLQTAIKALNEKLKFYSNIENEKDLALSQLAQTEQARGELRETIRETAARIAEDKDKFGAY